MLNKITGLYEAYKFIKYTNETLIGTGTTQALAAADLRARKKAYRAGSPVILSGTFNSPGYGLTGKISGIEMYGKIPNRVGNMWARKDLAAYLIEERKTVK